MAKNQIHQLSWRRIIKLALAIVLSIWVGVQYQPMISGNKDAVNTVVTIFSILAGFLIAVITLITEPVLMQASNLAELRAMKSTVERKLFRQNILFYLYLTTLGLALIMFLVPDTALKIQNYIQTAFLSLACFVFLASFTLPSSLRAIQMERYEAALDEKKPEALKQAQKKAKASKET